MRRLGGLALALCNAAVLGKDRRQLFFQHLGVVFIRKGLPAKR